MAVFTANVSTPTYNPTRVFGAEDLPYLLPVCPIVRLAIADDLPLGTRLLRIGLLSLHVEWQAESQSGHEDRDRSFVAPHHPPLPAACPAARCRIAAERCP